MNVQELIDELKKHDPKAPVYMYDAEWDVKIEVRRITTDDPRAEKKERLHKHTVWVSEF